MSPATSTITDGVTIGTQESPHLRLAEVYLNYAEAVNEAYGPTGSIPGGITAAEALNIVRNRAGVPDVDARYLNDKAAFREIARQERAVELCFEGHRWNDLRRWHIAHLLKYREKYHLEFDKEYTYFKKVLDVTTVHDEKHYWLPFEVAQVNMYPEFKQNPGW
ncbi:MAG: RagB/SusD family nutrient uptake outer membrane protein [Mangrovibacterium sp.]